MTKSPPEPIMDSTVGTLGNKFLFGHIKKHMSDYFVPGTGQIRRPDIVIVHDATKPPTQDNIKQIVEMKFPPDKLSERQERAYETIAGSPHKLTSLEPKDCDCDKSKPDDTRIPVEKIEAAGKIGEILMRLLLRGRSLGGIPGLPSPPPVPAF